MASNKKKLIDKDVIAAIAIENVSQFREAMDQLRLRIGLLDETDDAVAMRGTLVLRHRTKGIALEFVERS